MGLMDCLLLPLKRFLAALASLNALECGGWLGPVSA